ncbi:hypothetical protein F4808DRAFT_439726 [Astrocystis sublimbata]|nr:hypothetical protein F4808DRAFT_439726 [Astrocystis sublimbata]
MATYKDLSMELKVWIWEHVAAELLSGAHRFRLTQHPKRPGRLVLTPGNDEKQDSSTWRERIRLAKIDGASLYAFTKLLAKMEQGNEVKVVYHDTQRSRRINVAENGVAARVYRGTDLMTFRWNFGTTAGAAYALNTPANRSLFDGITQFGIEIDLIQKGWMHTTKYKPFVCLDCIQVPGHAGVGSVCYAGVLRFLELFKDLKIVYIVFTIKAVDCSSPEIEELKAMNTQPRRQVTDPKKARICQAALDAFQAIRSTFQPLSTNPAPGDR